MSGPNTRLMLRCRNLLQWRPGLPPWTQIIALSFPYIVHGWPLRNCYNTIYRVVYETWQNITVNNIPLTAGKTIRFTLMWPVSILRESYSHKQQPVNISSRHRQCYCCTGEQWSSVNIYPNPVSDAARIVLGNAVNGNYTLTLTRCAG